MNTYTEFLEKAQSEFLSGLKQAQELNLKTLASFKDLLSPVPTAEAVERTFAFTNEIIEARKAYVLKLAEMADETQKQIVEAAKRAASAN